MTSSSCPSAQTAPLEIESTTNLEQVMVYCPDRFDLTCLTHALKRGGFRVYAALTEVEAKHYLTTHRPAIVLCWFEDDITLRSIALLKYLRRVDAAVPIVAVSDETTDPDNDAALGRYADLLVLKPHNVSTIPDFVDAALQLFGQRSV